MAEENIVKSFRTTEAQFNAANEIFKKEGFNLSEVIRLLFDATIKGGRIPRGLSTKDIEDKSDVSKIREDFVDSIIAMTQPKSKGDSGLSPEEKLLKLVFGEPEVSKDMSNKELRVWGNKWGLPDNLEVSTLADLHDCGLFPDDPWFGEYDYHIDTNYCDENIMVLFKFRENLSNNLEKIKHQMEVKATKILMEYDSVEE